MKVYQALAQAVADIGTTAVFGLTGDANLQLVYSLMEDCGIDFYASAHEAGGISAADGYARVTNSVGIATVTHGPGLTNTVTALTEAVRARTPMVLIAGDTPIDARYHHQFIDQQPVIEPTGAGFEQVRSPETVIDDFYIAWRRAIQESRPIVLNAPHDTLLAEAGVAQDRDWQYPLANKGAAEPDAIAAANDVIRESSNPIILAGRGAVKAGAREAILELAQLIGAPVSTTAMAMDLFDGEAYNLGIFGGLSHPVADQAIANADCIIMLGASLANYTTMNGELTQGKKLIHVDIDPAVIGRRMPVDVGVVGDVKAVICEMIMQLSDYKNRGLRNEELRELLMDETKTQAPAGADGENTVDISRFMRKLNKTLPKNRSISLDAGRFLHETMKALRVPDPNAFVLACNFFSVGLGMGAAIGAAVARPDRPTVAVMGDGGFMMGGLAEFNTAVRYNLDLIVVVVNDGGYGAEYVQLLQRGMDPCHALLDWPDFGTVAQSLGGDALTIRGSHDFSQMEEAITNRDKPLLIDARIDPAVVPPSRRIR